MDTRTEEFVAYVQDGGLVEVHDWMPDEYRSRLVKFIEMHGNSELMGVLPERDWILRAPTLQRKLALTAKIQDEVGHAQLIYRVVEDLGKPRSRLPRRPRRRQVEVPQRLPLPDEDMGRRRRDRVARGRRRDRLAEGAAQVLVRAVRADHEEDLLGGVVPHPPRPRRDPRARDRDTGAVRARAGGARLRWWEPLMHFHGTPIPAEDDPMVFWRIKSQANEAARQEFLDGYVPQILELGLELPDPKLRKDAPTASGSTPSPTGTSSRPSCRGTARRRPNGSTSAGRHGRRWSGSHAPSSRRPRDPRVRGLPARAAGPAVPARRLGHRTRYAVRGDLRARAVRAPAGVGRSLARAARRRAGGRRVPRRVRPQVPPRGRLLDQGIDCGRHGLAQEATRTAA